MSAEGVETFPALCAPQLARLVKGAGGDLVPAKTKAGAGVVERGRPLVSGTANCSRLPVGVVEGHGVHHVPVTLQRVQLAARGRVPHTTRPVVAARQEPEQVQAVARVTHEHTQRHSTRRRGFPTHLEPDLSKATLVSGRM